MRKLASSNTEATIKRLEHVLHTPGRAVAAMGEYTKQFVSKGWPIGLPSLNQYMGGMVRPGELVVILAKSGNLKTSFMQWMARWLAKCIRGWEDEGEQTGKVVLYASWEQSVEEMIAYDLAFSSGGKITVSDIFSGNVDVSAMERELQKRVVEPIWLVGNSISHPTSDAVTIPMLCSVIVHLATSHQVFPVAVFVDYLQLIPSTVRDNRRVGVMDNVISLKHLATSYGVSVIVGCQVKRDVYERTYAAKDGLPRLHDGLETSSIEHAADRVLGLWYPRTTIPIGEPIEVGGVEYVVSENLAFVQVLKQRFGPCGKIFPLRVEPDKNVFGEWDGVCFQG